MALTYFVSDVHLGSNLMGGSEREKAFRDFLRGIDPSKTEALFLLGDIWDFWWEYKTVVPKGNERIFAALCDLMDAGVKVYFCEGNHDMWTFKYLQSLGIQKVSQPFVVRIGGAEGAEGAEGAGVKTFCVGHGDYLGPSPLGYRLMYWIMHCKALQFCYSLLHPTFAASVASFFSQSSRKRHYGKRAYVFTGVREPIIHFVHDFAEEHQIDHFVFGHYHNSMHLTFTNSHGHQSELHMLKDWTEGPAALIYDSESGEFSR